MKPEQPSKDRLESADNPIENLEAFEANEIIAQQKLEKLLLSENFTSRFVNIGELEEMLKEGFNTSGMNSKEAYVNEQGFLDFLARSQRIGWRGQVGGQTDWSRGARGILAHQILIEKLKEARAEISKNREGNEEDVENYRGGVLTRFRDLLLERIDNLPNDFRATFRKIDDVKDKPNEIPEMKEDLEEMLGLERFRELMDYLESKNYKKDSQIKIKKKKTDNFTSFRPETRAEEKIKKICGEEYKYGSDIMTIFYKCHKILEGPDPLKGSEILIDKFIQNPESLSKKDLRDLIHDLSMNSAFRENLDGYYHALMVFERDAGGSKYGPTTDFYNTGLDASDWTNLKEGCEKKLLAVVPIIPDRELRDKIVQLSKQAEPEESFSVLSDSGIVMFPRDGFRSEKDLKNLRQEDNNIVAKEKDLTAGKESAEKEITKARQELEGIFKTEDSEDVPTIKQKKKSKKK